MRWTWGGGGKRSFTKWKSVIFYSCFLRYQQLNIDMSQDTPKIQCEAWPHKHENTHKACISGTGHMFVLAVVMTIKFTNAVTDTNKPEGQTFVICPSITSPQNICAFPYLSTHSLLAITSTTQLTENTCVHMLLFTQFSTNYSLVRWYYDIYA